MLVRITVDNILVMFSGGTRAYANTVNFRYVTPETEKDGRRLIALKNAFVVDNKDWACVGNHPVVISQKGTDDDLLEFLEQTKNRGVLWVSVKRSDTTKEAGAASTETLVL